MSRDSVDDFLRGLGGPEDDDDARCDAERTPAGAAAKLRAIADRVERGEVMPEYVMVGLDLSDGRFDMFFSTNMKFSETLVALTRGLNHANQYIDAEHRKGGDSEEQE